MIDTKALSTVARDISAFQHRLRYSSGVFTPTDGIELAQLIQQTIAAVSETKPSKETP